MRFVMFDIVNGQGAKSGKASVNVDEITMIVSATVKSVQAQFGRGPRTAQKGEKLMSERFENGKSVFIWSELNDQYHDEEYTRRFYDAIPTAHRLWDAVIVRSSRWQGPDVYAKCLSLAGGDDSRIIPGINAAQWYGVAPPHEREFWEEITNHINDNFPWTYQSYFLLDCETLLSFWREHNWHTKKDFHIGYATGFRSLIESTGKEFFIRNPMILPYKYPFEMQDGYESLLREIRSHCKGSVIPQMPYKGVYRDANPVEEDALFNAASSPGFDGGSVSVYPKMNHPRFFTLTEILNSEFWQSDPGAPWGEPYTMYAASDFPDVVAERKRMIRAERKSDNSE